MSKIVYIYTLVNPLNNEIFYIGYTNNPKRRLREHIRYRYNPLKDGVIGEISINGLEPILNIIDKCDFTFNHCFNMFEHERLEIFYIKKYRESGIKLTNLTNGGGVGNVNYIPVYQFDEFGNFIKKYDSITDASNSVMVSISKISVALDQKINKSSAGFYWFTSVEKSKNIVFRKAAKRNIPIVQYSLDGKFIKKFKGQEEAERITNISAKLINKCLRKKGYDQAGGYMWFYEKNAPLEIKYRGRYLSKPIMKFTTNDEFVEEYTSIEEATIKNNFKSNIITSNLRGKTKTAGGYVWKYKE